MKKLWSLLLLLTLSLSAQAASPTLKAGVFEPALPAPEFTLAGSDGAALKLSRLRGKAVLLVFGFTHCPEVCPTTLATLAQARAALGAQAAGVQVVFVTVDPARDDAARIAKYLGAFDKGFLGATGSPAALEAVRKQYGVFAKKLPGPEETYGMNHSTSVFLIDREGRLRGMMPFGRPAADFVHDLKLMLGKA